jgi:tryptophan synthase alpha chain
MVCERIRERGITIPLIFMGSYNPIFSYGIEAFAESASQVGADAVIVPDLPVEEAQPLQSALKKSKLNLISMLAPTSTLERIKMTCGAAEGFIYCVSIAGVTGVRKEMPAGLTDFLGLVRQHTNLPLALGFGISEKVHIDYVSPYVQAVVIGSKLIEVINSSTADERIANVRDFIVKMLGDRVS